MNKQIGFAVFGGLVVIGLGVALFVAQPKEGDSANSGHDQMQMPSNTQSSRKLQSDLSDYDFGTISMKNGLVTKEFSVKNPETSPLQISRLYTSCMCTKAYLEINGAERGPFGMLGHGIVPSVNESLAPSAEAKVKVVFDPNAHGPAGVGVIERTVTAEDESGVILSLNIKANVIP